MKESKICFKIPLPLFWDTHGISLSRTITLNSKVAYWISSNIAIAILNFSLLLPLCYRSFNFAIAKLSLLIPLLHFFIRFLDWFMASFLYCFPYSYRSSSYCDSNSCRSFTLLKALAKSKSTHIAIAYKSEKEQDFTFTLRYRF